MRWSHGNVSPDLKVPDQYTRPATWQDVRTVVSLLEAHGTNYALIGGYAMAAHGYVRFSEDVDILVDPAPSNAKRWIAALSELPDGAAKVLADEPDIFSGEQRYAVRINDEFTVDVLATACGHAWTELERHIVEMPIDGATLKVLDLQGLLLTKEGQRPKDRMDAQVLRRALEQLTSD